MSYRVSSVVAWVVLPVVGFALGWGLKPGSEGASVGGDDRESGERRVIESLAGLGFEEAAGGERGEGAEAMQRITQG